MNNEKKQAISSVVDTQSVQNVSEALGSSNDIFISYARKDFGVVMPIVKEIEVRTEVKPWIDLDGIETGSQFQDKIINAINKCKVFVFMASPNALRSEWTQKEIAFAKRKQKKICPIVVTECELPDWFLFEYSTVDVINYHDEQQREKFLRNMAEWTGNRVKAKEEAVRRHKLKEFQAKRQVAEDEAKSLEKKIGNLQMELDQVRERIRQYDQEMSKLLKSGSQTGCVKEGASEPACKIASSAPPPTPTEAQTSKMVFQYVAKDNVGNERQGTVEADNPSSAIVAIRSIGLLPSAIGVVKGEETAKTDKSSMKLVNGVEVWCGRDFASMFGARMRRVTKVSVREGQFVHKGDELLLLVEDPLNWGRATSATTATPTPFHAPCDGYVSLRVSVNEEIPSGRAVVAVVFPTAPERVNTTSSDVNFSDVFASVFGGGGSRGDNRSWGD